MRKEGKFVFLGDPRATWDDISCPHLKEDKTCGLASALVKAPVATKPYDCSICSEWSDGQTHTCRTVHRLAENHAKKENKSLHISIEDRLGEGVGTELHKMIPAFLEKKGCNCKSFALKMNVWGPDGCEKNRTAIINRLVQESKQRDIFGWLPESATAMVANKLLTTAIKRARQKGDDSKDKWFCAVTTAPRQIPTVQTCLESLVVAGFNPFVFAEPGSQPLSHEFKPFLIQNKKRKGVWHNFLFSVKYALENSNAETIITVQDDSLFHPDCKSFLEDHVLWPDERVGFVSLYTPKHYSKKPNKKTMMRPFGVNRIITKSMWGACGLVWPRKVLEEMLELDNCVNWLGARTKSKDLWQRKQLERRKNPEQIQNSDTAIGKLMNQMGRTMWFCAPSPVQHFATTSAINHGGNKGRRNCGRCALWTQPLVDQIPLQTNGEPLNKFSYDQIQLSNEFMEPERLGKARYPLNYEE